MSTLEEYIFGGPVVTDESSADPPTVPAEGGITEMEELPNIQLFFLLLY